MTMQSQVSKEQANAQRLLSAINESRGKKGLFCNNCWAEIVEDSYFTFKTPSTCGGCHAGLSFLERCEPNWRQVPYVQFKGDREFHVSYGALKAFAEEGEAGFKQWKRRKSLEAAKMQMDKEIARQAKMLGERVEQLRKAEKVGVKASPAMERYLLQQDDLPSLVLGGPDLAAWCKETSHNTGMGMSYFSNLHVYANGGVESASYQWRDGRSASNDSPSSRIDGVHAVRIVGRSVEVTISNGSSRSTRSVALPKPVEVPTDASATLSASEQLEFITQLQEAIAEMLTGKLEMHQRKPKFAEMRVPSAEGYQSYRLPLLLWQRMDLVHGMAAWAYEEQIDAHVNDRQMRVQVFALRFGGQPKEVHESHAYENEGLASAEFETFAADGVVIRTGHDRLTLHF